MPDLEEHMAGVDHMVMGRGTDDVVAGLDEWPYGDVPVIVVSSPLPEGTQRVIVVRSIHDAATLLDGRGADELTLTLGGGMVRSTYEVLR